MTGWLATLGLRRVCCSATTLVCCAVLCCADQIELLGPHGELGGRHLLHDRPGPGLPRALHRHIPNEQKVGRAGGGAGGCLPSGWAACLSPRVQKWVGQLPARPNGSRVIRQAGSLTCSINGRCLSLLKVPSGTDRACCPGAEHHPRPMYGSSSLWGGGGGRRAGGGCSGGTAW